MKTGKNNIKELLKKEGFFFVFKKVIRRLTRYIYYRTEFLFLERPLELSNSLPEEYEIRKTERDPDFLPQVKKYFPKKYKLFKRRLDNKILFCCGVYFKNENKLVGYAWLATGKYFEPTWRYSLDLASNQIYIFDGYLMPEFRKGMLSTYLYADILNKLAKEGYTRAIAAVDKSITKKFRFHSHMNFSETGKKAVIHYIFGIAFTHLESYSERYLGC